MAREWEIIGSVDERSRVGLVEMAEEGITLCVASPAVS